MCIDSVCAAAACKPGIAQCADAATLHTCKADGTGWEIKACGSDAACVVDTCKPLVCEAGVGFCTGNVAMACSPDGTATATVADCAVKGQLCLAGACVAKSCEPGSALCADTKTVAQCSADGSGYVKTACAADKGCANGQCVPKVCKPGEDVCNGNLVMHCNPAGTALTQTSDCAATGKVCSNGACATATQVCTPGAKSCAGLTFKTCKAEGTGWVETLCDDGNVCTSETCDVQLGCGKVPVADGSQCGSGQVCKAGVCSAAAACATGAKKCAGAKLLTCKADGSGWDESACNDGNPCTADGCSETEGCNVVGFPDGTACGAGSVCKGGVCGAANACGNGKLDFGEECDDGNNQPCDGCEGCKLRSALKLASGGAWGKAGNALLNVQEATVEAWFRLDANPSVNAGDSTFFRTSRPAATTPDRPRMAFASGTSPLPRRSTSRVRTPWMAGSKPPRRCLSPIPSASGCTSPRCSTRPRDPSTSTANCSRRSRGRLAPSAPTSAP
ncbi:MAG: DUF4215 domain-containing protein [Deltaproteobacteria bacterium]|nr:DUF4215 domain-containing protein [Deltaproteobacteria bacterium]